ncbi:hypothetical protein MBLNU13_g06763t3 [Cladosporium sp. NU13]
MRVLLLGATGNLGSRLIPALLTHGHNVVAYVRSTSKLESLIPAIVHEQITVVQGDATDSQAIKKAIISHNCEAVVSTAGVAALAPWAKSELPVIFKAVLDAVREAGSERQSLLRVWFLGGQGVLYYPGTQSMLSNHFPIFLEHRQNLQLLRSLPPNAVNWSMLCPNWMVPEYPDVQLTGIAPKDALEAKAGTPPHWNDSWVRHIPFIGKTIVSGMNASRYKTTLEQNAEFIASDLGNAESEWKGQAVGIITRLK